MRKSPKLIALIALFVFTVGVLSGCKSDEQKEQDAAMSDIESLLDQAGSDDVTEMDLSGEMDTEIGREMQELLKIAQKMELDFLEASDKWLPENYIDATSLADSILRSEYSSMNAEYKTAIAHYRTETTNYYDLVYDVVKRYDGQSTPDPNITLRIGMKAMITAFDDLTDTHQNLIDFCEAGNPTVGSDGLLDFETVRANDKFMDLTVEMTEAENDLVEKATVFDQMRVAHMNNARDAMKEFKGN